MASYEFTRMLDALHNNLKMKVYATQTHEIGMTCEVKREAALAHRVLYEHKLNEIEEMLQQSTAELKAAVEAWKEKVSTTPQ